MFTKRFILIGLLLFFMSFLIGCETEHPPQVVARYFWDALKIQDVESARACVTTATRTMVDTSTSQFHNAEVTFGKIIIDGDKTTLETIIHMRKNDAEIITPLQTILVREDNMWKVDYQQTINTMPVEDTSLAEVTKNLQELGVKLSGKMDEAVGEIKKKIPEYEEKLKKLGEEVSRKVDEAVQGQLSEINKRIKELGEILDEVLKKESGTSTTENKTKM